MLALPFACAALLSCGDDPADPVAPPVPEEPPRPAAISISPAAVQLSALGDTARLTADIRDQFGRPLQGAQVSWASGDPAVAAVDVAGLVTAVANGEAAVTATSGEAAATVQVAVRQVTASVAVSPEELRLTALGDTARLSAEVRDARGHSIADPDVAWTSDNPSVARIDETGLVTAVADGEARVTATSGEADEGISVLVRQSAASATIAPGRLDFEALGDTARVSASIRDARGHAIPGLDVAWSSSDPAVVAVDGTGLVTAIGTGDAVVTAAAGGAEATVPAAVRQKPSSVAIKPGRLDLAALGDTARLLATIRDARGHAIPGLDVAWRSSAAAVAVVDGAGLVTAVGNGDAAVTAAAGEAEATVPIGVRQAAASLAIAPGELSLIAPGDTARVSATVRDAGGSPIEDAEVAWSSSDPAIITVDETGLVVAIARGEATVTAISGEVDRTVSVAVRQSAHSVPCVEGRAGRYPCDGVDLISHVSPGGLRPGAPVQHLNDAWGWTDPVAGTEYALVGRTDGLSIVDLSDPWHPRPLAFLPSPTAPSEWRDVKVHADHAYVVADQAPGHGVQILDLTRLRDLDEFTELAADGRYTRVSSVHNIAINEETGFAYAVGSQDGGETCGGGLHMIDLSNPTMPVFAGCHHTRGTGWLGTGYTHDVQCVTYHGPDRAYTGREICVGSNETRVVVSDVTDKSDPITLSTAAYPSASYVHQGWFDEDHRFFYQNDELDEYYGLVAKSRTMVWDLTDLDDPVLAEQHLGPSRAVDHNLYVRGDLLYASNYTFGVRILDISTRRSPTQTAFFDTVPYTNEASLDGAWSNYPYFESGLLIVTSIAEGLFVLRLQGLSPMTASNR